MRKKFQIILSTSLLVLLLVGFGAFTFTAQKFIYKEIVEQVISDNQVIADQIVHIIDDLQLDSTDQEQTKDYLKQICNTIKLPNSGFLCAANPKGDVVAAPWLDKRPNVNLSSSRLRNLRSDSTFQLRTMRAMDSFQGYARLPDNNVDVVVSMPLNNSKYRILVHQDNAAIEDRARQYVRPLMLIGIAISLSLAVITFFATDRIISRYQLRIEKQNNELRNAFDEIKEKNEEIASQNEELERQRDVANDQRKEITESIEYAWHIQQAMLPSQNFISSLVKDYMIFFRPRDIVSGDFYWMNVSNGRTFVVAADCTGHGVPGAFMSMLGMTFLNEAVLDHHMTHPEAILEFLREKIIEALNQKAEKGQFSTYDGMDMALVVINNQSMHMEYAGANNGLYLVRGGELRVIKPNKMPVGIYKKQEDFARQEMQLQKDDILYLFTDGFPDQFGGARGKKFRYKPFRNLIMQRQQETMERQKQHMANTFDEWKGAEMQVDDVLVLGLKV